MRPGRGATQSQSATDVFSKGGVRDDGFSSRSTFGDGTCRRRVCGGGRWHRLYLWKNDRGSRTTAGSGRPRRQVYVDRIRAGGSHRALRVGHSLHHHGPPQITDAEETASDVVRWQVQFSLTGRTNLLDRPTRQGRWKAVLSLTESL